MEDSKDVMEEIENAINTGELVAADGAKSASLNEKANYYGVASAKNRQEFSFENRDDTTEQAMSFIDLIFEGIGDGLVSGRDKVYVNEYILMRFSSHDFKKEGAAKICV